MHGRPGPRASAGQEEEALDLPLVVPPLAGSCWVFDTDNDGRFEGEIRARPAAEAGGAD